MGLAYDNVGDFDEAMVCYDRALVLRRTIVGNDHLLKVAETCHSIFYSKYIIVYITITNFSYQQ